LTNHIDLNNLLIIASEINLKELKTCFNFYRGKLTCSILRIINTNYLSFLKNISAIHKLNNDKNISSVFNNKNIIIKRENIYNTNHNVNEDNKLEIFDSDNIKKKIEEIIISINIDFKLFYYTKKNSKNILNQNSSKNILRNDLSMNNNSFKEKKQIFVEIHEILTRIGLRLTTNIEYSYSLINSKFYCDIIDYLAYIANTTNLIQRILNQNNNKKDILSVKSILTSIVENSISVLVNGFKCLIFDKSFSAKDIVTY